jgi:hypothetical protein
MGRVGEGGMPFIVIVAGTSTAFDRRRRVVEAGRALNPRSRSAPASALPTASCFAASAALVDATPSRRSSGIAQPRVQIAVLEGTSVVDCMSPRMQTR